MTDDAPPLLEKCKPKITIRPEILLDVMQLSAISLESRELPNLGQSVREGIERIQKLTADLGASERHINRVLNPLVKDLEQRNIVLQEELKLARKRWWKRG